jgi:FHA domain-containing protein
MAEAPRQPGEARRGAVVSWDGGARQATIVAPASAARRNGVLATTSGGTRPGIRPAAAAPAQAAPAAAGSPELLQAFLEGLATVQAAPPITALTPGLMRLIGTLLAESVSGAVDLLHARASVKREVRAEVTAIRPRQNNPLKFSPTAALALQHLLGPTVPGFLRPDEAMRDTFRDLRAHELAVMAGMRSALSGLLQRFDPKALESRITGKSGLGMLLSGGRRAQLWEAYQELFGQLSAEAEDDFHEVFGRAFLQAYQEQLDRLNADDGAGGS